MDVNDQSLFFILAGAAVIFGAYWYFRGWQDCKNYYGVKKKKKA